MTVENFKALVVEEVNEEIKASVKMWQLADLSDGETIIRTNYSGVNYKDALATIKNGGVIRSYPMIPGIDAIGEVVETTATHLKVGDTVVITGKGLGVSHTGGFSEIVRVPNDWPILLPKTVTPKEAAIIGTAGVTAIESINELERNGLSDKEARILVTGATGGVGSIGIAMLKSLGYKNITALSRKKNEEFLLSLGAKKVISLDEFMPEKIKPLQKQEYDFVLDTVGGDVVSAILPQINYGGAITLCGNASGIKLSTTVLPFILRGIKLLGVDSVQLPNERKEAIWNRVGEELDKSLLEKIGAVEVSLDDINEVVSSILEATHSGRTLIKL
ncbi:YhdH/YhfP family quinone oxidoreductase [Vagococcus fluvialis]|uniref:YhdH/YhfP family quinone oxidoreductase n=1 Tax=Vagococcus fluvialis TaxID=2738 RepID=UPI003B5B538C